MLKRLSLLMAAVFLLGSLFAGCGGSSTNPQGTQASATKAAEQETTKAKNPEYINLITPFDFPQEVLDKFKEKTGIEVKKDYIPNSDTDYKQVRNARMAAGSELDIIASDHQDPVDFAQKGTVIELTNEPFMKNFSEDALIKMSAQTQTPGKQYSVIYETMAFGVWYNKDIFKKYGLEPPTNYQDFITVCETLKKNGVVPLIQGEKDIWPLDQELNMVMYPLQNKNPRLWIDLYKGKIKFTDPDIKALAKRLEIIYPSKGYYLPGSLSTSYDQAWQILLQQKAAMWFMGSWATEVMNRSNVKPDFEVGVFNPPMNDKGEAQFNFKVMSRNFHILTSSEKIDAAKQFLGFLAEPDIAKLFADKAMTISTVKGVASDTMVAGADWAKINELPSVPDLEGIDTDGKIYTQSPEWSKVRNMLEAKIMAGELTTDQYCEELQKAMDIDIKNYK